MGRRVPCECGKTKDQDAICCKDCKKVLIEKKNTHVCKGCGKSFIRKPASNRKMDYCTRECAYLFWDQWNAGTKKGWKAILGYADQQVVISCSECGQMVKRKTLKQMTCGEKCSETRAKLIQRRLANEWYASKVGKTSRIASSCDTCGIQIKQRITCMLAECETCKRKRRNKANRIITTRRERKLRERRYDKPAVIAKWIKECLRANNNKCMICRKQLRLQHNNDSMSMEVDHTMPVARGGTDTIDNLRTICRGCNNFKLDHVPVERLGEVLNNYLHMGGQYIVATESHRTAGPAFTTNGKNCIGPIAYG